MWVWVWVVGVGVGAMAVSSDGAFAYVVSEPSSVSVVDLNERAVIDTIEVGFAPSAVVVSDDGAYVYVSHIVGVEEFEVTLGPLWVIDTETRTVIGTFSLGQDTFARALAVSPDGAQLYVLNSLGLSVIEIATGDVSGIPVGSGAVRVVFSPDGAHAYVSDVGEDTVWVIDTASKTVTDVVGVGHDPFSIAVSSDGARVYVVSGFDRTISVIDAVTNTVIGTLDAGHGASLLLLMSTPSPPLTPPAAPHLWSSLFIYACFTLLRRHLAFCACYISVALTFLFL